jgi:hypothetical protein
MIGRKTELLSDLVGVAGLALVCTGVYLLWGVGWTCVGAGLPLVVLYAWREFGVARQGRRG